MAVNLEHLRVLVRIAREPTFAAAAERLRVTPSAVSQHVKMLEAELGTILFEKAGRGVRMTADAEALVEGLGPLIAQIDERIEVFTGESDVVRGAVTIGGPDVFCRMWLLPRIAAAAKAYGELSLDVRYAKNDQVEKTLVSGEIDFAILVAAPESPAVEAVPIYREELVAVASPAYLSRYGEPETPSELEAHRFVLFDPTARMQDVWLRAVVGPKATFRGKVVCTVRDLDQILDLAKADVGIGIVPNHMADPSVEKGELVVLTMGKEPPKGRRRATNVIYLAWRKSHREAARLRAVRELLLEGTESAKKP